VNAVQSSHAANFQRFNLYALDESRFGLLTLAHKALAAKGVKPLCRFQHRFDTTYLYGAFSPVNGAHFLLELPTCNTENFQAFLNEFSKADEEEFKIVLLDNAAFHKAKTLKRPCNVHLLFLPPYAPELNPAEKVWWRLKREMKNRSFKTLQDLQEAITKAIEKTVTTQQIQQLCSYACYQAINMN
jgi:transposase